MSLQLPRKFYRPDARKSEHQRWLVPLCIFAVLFAGWQLAGLPGTLVRRFKPPVDMPWFNFGIMGAYIEADGKWVLHRVGYADRMNKYDILPDGTLVKTHETGVYDQSLDQSGGKGHGVQLPGGSVLNVRPSRDYYQWLRKLRATGQNTVADPNATQLPAPTNIGRRNRLPATAPYVLLRIFRDSQAQQYGVLAGRHYYPVYDAVNYVAPYLWITTDRLRYLHKLYLTDASGKLELREELSVPLEINEVVTHDSDLGLDATRGQLALILPTGTRIWFDPQTLKQVGCEKMPGVWEREYASIGNFGALYSYDRGWALTERQYNWLMRSLVLIMLGGLLYLALTWRLPWTFIAAATTAASSSSSSSSPTSNSTDTAASTTAAPENSA